MKLGELRSLLASKPESSPGFILPDGGRVPDHFHLTEVGHVTKNFIDCGGTVRKSEGAVLQLWVNDSDRDHRLNAGKFAAILALGDKVGVHDNLDVEVEYDQFAVSQFPIEKARRSGEAIEFLLSSKHTDCLAKERCGVNEQACCGEETVACC
jgi:hypothetical protein